MRTGPALDLAAATGLFVLGLLLATSATADFRFSVAADPRDFSGADHDTVDYFRGVCEAMAALGSGDFMVSPGDIDHPPEPPGSPADVYWTIEK
ncbi:MAG: hypothetical protein GWO24_28010, partial [Akkermansiaceae bacterium]|nr:hypothetical protein [Akkermansiaceae bacterium]